MDFIFVQYRGNEYPEGIKPMLVEVAGHFGKESIEDHPSYSLHTEYSYGKRELSSDFIMQFPELCEANKDGVPQLWKSEKWSEQFAGFIIELTKTHSAPKVIEVHPPFNDYCDMDQFIDRYRVFERYIHRAYPDTDIVIENRAGTVYRGGKFIISKAKEISQLCEVIKKDYVPLGVVLDFPQLLTAERIKTDSFDTEKYSAAIDTIYPNRDVIKGIHIWGKEKNQAGRWVAHNGTLDTYIVNPDDKATFIAGIKRICSDNQERYFVPEVNSGGDDFKAVVCDVIR